MIKTPIRLYHTEDRKRIVPHGHADAAFLYAGANSEIKDDVADKLGLKGIIEAAQKEAPAPEAIDIRKTRVVQNIKQK